MGGIEIPAEFGYSFLTWGVLTHIATFMAGGKVMAARKKYEIKYPNMYAVPGYHKQADEFNSVQRGAQNPLETLTTHVLLGLFGSLYGPNAALANAVGGVLFNVGNRLYLEGYSTNEGNGGGRYKKGGIVKHIGGIIAIITSVATAIKIISS